MSYNLWLILAREQRELPVLEFGFKLYDRGEILNFSSIISQHAARLVELNL